jgi:hypothetical protein
MVWKYLALATGAAAVSQDVNPLELNKASSERVERDYVLEGVGCL